MRPTKRKDECLDCFLKIKISSIIRWTQHDIHEEECSAKSQEKHQLLIIIWIILKQKFCPNFENNYNERNNKLRKKFESMSTERTTDQKSLH